jgi:Pellino
MIFFSLDGIRIIMIFIFRDILLKDILGTLPPSPSAALYFVWVGVERFVGGADGRDPVSRLAFRVQCCRSNPSDLKIAAAGFDYANELFLGPFALRWGTQAEGGPAGGLDGGITVGLYMWKPHNPSPEGEITGDWYEISALGELYHLRVAGQRGRKANDVNNTLTDGW